MSNSIAMASADDMAGNTGERKIVLHGVWLSLKLIHDRLQLKRLKECGAHDGDGRIDTWMSEHPDGDYIDVDGVFAELDGFAALIEKAIDE